MAEKGSSYVFVSYAHKDANKVLPCIDAMKRSGINLWYDQGIAAGSEWPEFVANKVIGCAKFVLFVSAAYMQSQNCKRELNFAISRKKDILTIYLEDVKLSPGMEMQLGTYQALFCSRFASEEYFQSSLCDEEFFDDCRMNGGEVNADRDEQSDVPEFTSAPSLIRTVCCKGSCDFNNAFPTDGVYSDTIDKTRYNVVYFHLKTAAIDATQIKGGMRIYDSSNRLVYQDETTFQWRPNYDTLSRSWVIRGTDGFFVRDDTYKAVFWIDNSVEYEHYFRVVSPGKENPAPADNQKTKEQIKRLQDWLSKPRGFLCFVWFMAAVMLFAVAVSEYEDSAAVALLIGAIIAWIFLFRYTRRHVCKNFFGALALSLFALSYYGVYLFVCTILWVFKGRKWRRELKELKRLAVQ